MNYENLHTIIERYEKDLDEIYGNKHDELFKWRAVKAWQDAFHSAGSSGSFRERFSAAKKQFSIFMDNGFQHPSTGVLKLWEKEPETVERLFRDVLLSDFGGDVSKAESNMNTFLDEYELLRIRYYPEAVSYKMDPHIASVFMVLDRPGANYVFRISVARRMAGYIGFEDDLGSGGKPDLVNYYKLCDLIVSALKEHKTLLEEHFSFLTDGMYEDRSLHLMVFDLMHCSGYRGYYTGLSSITIGKPKKRTPYTGPSAEEIARKEQERLEQIAELERQIQELEISVDDFEEISLIGVEVSFPKYGKGTVVKQEVNKITVRFPEVEKNFVLDKSYAMRPRFENDNEVIEAFTEYGRAYKEIEKLKKQLNTLDHD